MSEYRGRSAVEREFGRLKHLHADLTILGRLALELAKTR
jgi:hypothetical protein